MYLLHISTMPGFLWHFNGMSKVFAYFRKLYSDILEENYASEIVSYIEKKEKLKFIVYESNGDRTIELKI